MPHSNQAKPNGGPVIELNYRTGIVVQQVTTNILGTTNYIKILGTENGLVHFIPFLPNP